MLLGSITGSVGLKGGPRGEAGQDRSPIDDDLREALWAGGLPRSTPYDRGRHVQADDSFRALHLRRVVRPAACAQPPGALSGRGWLAHQDRAPSPLKLRGNKLAQRAI